MPSRIAPAALLAVLACLLVAPAQARTDQAFATGQYVVVLKQGVDAGVVADEQAKKYGLLVDSVYRKALTGYAADVPLDRLAALRADGSVASVEPDVDLHELGQVLPWGVDRIDADLSSTKAGNGSGAVSNVNVYVIDSGIGTKVSDVNVAGMVSFAKGGNAWDCDGHGSHVTGTIAAMDNGFDVVGVAPGAPVTAVKVLGCNGSGSLSGIIAGIDWVTANAVKPAVANLSLGGPASDALDQAVRNSAASGIVYSVAAGNDGGNACNVSPARVGGTAGVVTAAATDSADQEASFSDFGPCVDLWAPGVGIVSTSAKGGTESMSGTSMSAPHVAGTAALYLSSHPTASPAAVEAALKSASVGTGTKSKDGRPIRLVYAGRF
jgi:subtilisin family serine protease